MEDYTTFGDAIACVTSDIRANEDDWSVKLAERALGILKARFSEFSHYRVLVLQKAGQNAFTTNGNHTFLTRSLLELCSTVEMAAFVIAHEIAHHELRHIPVVSVLLKGRLRAIAFLLQCFGSPVNRARKECEADMLAIDMCVEAGLSGKECLRALQVLEKITLDKRGIGSAMGSDVFYCAEMSSFQRRWKIAVYLLRFGYYPVRVRRILAERHIGICKVPFPVFLS